MKRSLVIVLLLGTLLGACGESDEEQAQDAVCDARASIQKQVDELSGPHARHRDDGQCGRQPERDPG